MERGADVAKLKMVGLRHVHTTLTGPVVLYCVSRQGGLGDTLC